MKRYFPLLGFILIGCSVNPGKTPDASQLEGRDTLMSKPVTDMTLNLQPTGAGTQAVLPVKNGAVKGSVTPGKYTYYLSEGSNAKSFKGVPERYRAGSLDRQIEITNGNMDFVFE